MLHATRPGQIGIVCHRLSPWRRVPPSTRQRIIPFVDEIRRLHSEPGQWV